ncbi:MAG: hypothetical protein V5A46_08775 [Haloferacaceae archaeon]
MNLEGLTNASRGVADWLRTSTDTIRENGFEGLRDVGQDLYGSVWWLTWPLPIGTNVYDREWDVLVILDACRVDLLRSVSDEYDYLGDVDRLWSVGSMSKEWMAKTFVDDYSAEVRETAYVTANVFSERMTSADWFRALEEVWRNGWDRNHGTVPPRAVTDSAIRTARTVDPERLIVHYVQPHHPFLPLDRGYDARPFGPDAEDTVVDALRKEKIDRDRFWKAYRDNLRLVLDDLELLLANVDADNVAITADHGDALGEWGIYDHPVGFLHPAVRSVPWVTTTATDERTHEPEGKAKADGNGVSVRKRLQSLGYLD